MNIYSYHGIRPIIKPSAYIHPQAVIIGNVEIGEEVYIGPNAVIRGDWGKLLLKTEPMFRKTVPFMFFRILKPFWKNLHISVMERLFIPDISGKTVLIGMNSVVMDKAVIGDESIIGALAFVPANFKCEPEN
jgi:phenylacetic acid degradation protein